MSRTNHGSGSDLDQVHGVVESVLFAGQGEEGLTWRVVRLRPSAAGAPFVATGVLPRVDEGQELRLTGEWVEHPRHGRQFKAHQAEVLPPSTRAGVLRYLGSGTIKGVGPKLAERIVAALGEQALERIEADPEILLQVPGIGTSKAASVAGALQAQAASRAALVFLRGLGLGEAMARKVYQAYGGHTVAAIQANPFRLAQEVIGLGFRRSDQIARNLGVAPDSPHRLAAGTLYTLREAAGEGHSFLPLSELTARAVELLQQEPEKVAAAIESLASQEEVQVVPGPGPVPEDPAVYPSLLAWSELELARKVTELLGRPVAPLSPDLERILAEESRSSRLEIAGEQKEALTLALTRPLSVITGGPGVGKTTLIQLLIAVLDRAQVQVQLAAPTGRAARRLAEVTGREAATIHRMLGYNPHRHSFDHDHRNPLPADLLVVDEVSMLDVQLASRLFRAIGPKTRVVLVGDADQLPSVGPGQVLGDLVATPSLPVTRLQRIFRQQERSLIVENAHRILQGLPPLFADGPRGDFFFVEKEEPAAILEMVLRLVTERIPQAFGFDPVSDIQVLAPMYRGEAGADRLNQELQTRLVPPGPEISRGAKRFRVGDKVIQIRNDYDRDLFNGDLGRVERVDPATASMEVRFDQGLVPCTSAELDQLLPAFAMSVHRAQGSEFPAVVLPLSTQHYMMLQRNLFYTAVTRARRLVVLVGSRRALHLALGHREAQTRYSGLSWRLAGPQE